MSPDIPKKIHFIWIGNETHPKKYNKFIDSFRKHNPDFEIKIWYEKDILPLFKDPDLSCYEDRWKSLELIIMKCDLSRSLVLHNQGGLYVDMDFNCYKNLGPMLANRDLFLVREPKVNGNRIGNYVYGGTKGHKFFKGWLDYSFKKLEEVGKRGMTTEIFEHVNKITGPGVFYDFVTSEGYDYEKTCCSITPLCKNGTVCKECIKDGVVKNVDGYHEIIGNYMDTLWHEGTGYMNDRSVVDILIFACNKTGINFVFFIVILIIVFGLIVYGLYRSIVKGPDKSYLIQGIFD